MPLRRGGGQSRTGSRAPCGAGKRRGIAASLNAGAAELRRPLHAVALLAPRAPKKLPLRSRGSQEGVGGCTALWQEKGGGRQPCRHDGRPSRVPAHGSPPLHTAATRSHLQRQVRVAWRGEHGAFRDWQVAKQRARSPNRAASAAGSGSNRRRRPPPAGRPSQSPDACYASAGKCPVRWASWWGGSCRECARAGCYPECPAAPASRLERGGGEAAPHCRG